MADVDGIELSTDVHHAWETVLNDWENGHAHERFIALCSATRRLPQAGAAYRYVRDHDPERREEATRRIDEIMTLAMQQLEPLRTPPRRQHSGIYYAALGISSSLAFYALWALMRGG